MSLELGHLAPIELMLEKCMYPYIIQRYDTVCATLLQILKEEHKLLEYFAVIRVKYLSIYISWIKNLSKTKIKKI